MPETGLSLRDLVAHIREELDAIRNMKSSRTDPIMELKKLELEVTVTVSVDAKGGLKFWILNLGAEAGGKETHKVKLSFEPYQMITAYPPSGGSGGTGRLRDPDIEEIIRSQIPLIKKPGPIVFNPPSGPGPASFPGPLPPG